MQVESTVAAEPAANSVFALPPIEECFPDTGAIKSYMDMAKVYWPSSNLFNHLGVLIPTMLLELNLRGFHIPDMQVGLRAAPLSWYSLILGVTGSGKSTAFDTCRTFFDDCVYGEFQSEGKLFASRLVNLEGTVSGFVGQMITLKTDEGIVTAMLHADEFSSILASRKGQYNANIAEFLQTIHDGREYVRHIRKSQQEEEDEAIPKPKVTGVFLSTLEAVQPVFTQELASGGLFGRMVVFNINEAGERPYMGTAMAAEERELRREVLAKATLEMQQWTRGMSAMSESNDFSPQIAIGKEAHDVFEQTLYNFVQAEQKNVSVPMQSLIARICNKAWILAALYAVNEAKYEIREIDAVRAVNLLLYCYNSSKYTSMRIGVSENVTAFELVRDAIEKAGPAGIQRSDLYNVAGMPATHKTKSAMDSILATMLDKNLATKDQIRLGKAGRPAEKWISTKYEKES